MLHYFAQYYTKIHYITLYNTMLHYIPLHYTIYNILRNITFYYSNLNFYTYYTKLHNIKLILLLQFLHDVSIRYIILHCIAKLHYIPPYFNIFRQITIQYNTLQYIVLCFVTMHKITQITHFHTM
jgi:hypothetical protein